MKNSWLKSLKLKFPFAVGVEESMVEIFMVEKSGVEKFIIEKSGVGGMGLKILSWDVLQPIFWPF